MNNFLSLLFIIILYYIQKRTMNKYSVKNVENAYPIQGKGTCKIEYYQTDHNKLGKCKKTCSIDGLEPLNTSALAQGSKITRSDTYKRFCNDDVIINPDDPNYISSNQRLAGKPNPKTLIAPIITPPLADLDYWRANNLINHSHINTESQTDTYLSGYQVSNCCDRINAYLIPAFPKKESFGNIIEGFDYDEPSYIGISDQFRPVAAKCNPLSMTQQQVIKSPQPVTTVPFSCTVNMENQGIRECEEKCPYSAIRQKNTVEGYEGFSCKEGTDDRDPLPRNAQRQIISPQPSTTKPIMIQENFEYPYEKTDSQFVRPNESGWVNTMCGYNNRQITESNLPSNYASGNCDRDEALKQYNKNLFTQTIQPDVYTINEVIEPINSNMGISFTQQFEPTTCSRYERGALTYTEHDPRVYQPKIVPNTPDMSVTEADVYDPRFIGYGTSYRAYTDKNIGQTRFYYDDVNAVRMPNYIVRSNIDFANYADTYGPLSDDNKYGNKYNSNIRSLAQDTFLRSSLQQRDDLMERLMRKRNAELHQLRSKPHSQKQFMTGSIRL